MSSQKEKKLLLRDWLEKQLNSGEAVGIQWYQKESGTFQILWRHANNPTWMEEDGWIYREWAIHKAHYKPNPDGSWPEADYPAWKARFRCALKRCNDIEEVKIEKRPGHEKQKLEVRLYKLLPKRERSMPVLELAMPVHVNSQPVVGAMVTSASQPVNLQTSVVTTGTLSTDAYNTVAFLTQEEYQKLPSNIPAVLSGIQGTPPSSMVATEVPVYHLEQLSGGLQNILTTDLFQIPSGALEEYGNAIMDVSMGNSIEIDNTGAVVEMPDSVSYLSFRNPPEDHDMCLWLRYRNYVVGKHYISNTKGCRIYYSSEGSNFPPLSDQFVGSNHVGFPSPAFYVKAKMNATNLENTEKLLSYMGNGLHIYCDNDGNIYATRLSQCRIFYVDPAMNAAVPVPLPRKHRIKVFDSDKFRQNLRELQAVGGNAPRPSVSVLFSFGEQWSLTKPIDKTLISATLINAQCWHHLSKYLSMLKTQQEGGEVKRRDEEIEDLSEEFQKMSYEHNPDIQMEADTLG